MKKKIALLSGLAILSTCAMGVWPVQATHTFESEWSEERYEQELANCADKYILGEDGVFYILPKYDFEFETYAPNVGTFDRNSFLKTLLYWYPDGRFAVWLESYGNDGYNTQTEIERLRQNGIKVSVMEDGQWFAILNAEQLENFPVDETVGYLIRLAPKPAVTVAAGDVNNDSKIDLADVVVLNKHLMIGYYLDEDSLAVADVDKNGIVDETDSLNILKSIIGLVDLDELS